MGAPISGSAVSSPQRCRLADGMERSTKEPLLEEPPPVRSSLRPARLRGAAWGAELSPAFPPVALQRGRPATPPREGRCGGGGAGGAGGAGGGDVPPAGAAPRPGARGDGESAAGAGGAPRFVCFPPRPSSASRGSERTALLSGRWSSSPRCPPPHAGPADDDSSGWGGSPPAPLHEPAGAHGDVRGEGGTQRDRGGGV